MKRAFSLLTATSVAVLVSGCGSNNGATFTPDSFSALGASSSVKISGTARSMSVNIISGNRVEVASAPTLVATTATLRTNADRELNSLRIEAPDLGLERTLNEDNAIVSYESVTTGLANPVSMDVTTGTANDGSFIVQATGGPTGTPYEYQTFGRWVQVTSASTADMAYFSVGWETAVAGIPTSGQMTYEGLSHGEIITYQENEYFAVANAAATVDFGPNQNFTFATKNTILDDGSNPFSDPDWNFNGGGSLTGTTMTGAVTSTSAQGFLNGTVDAQLYGPTASEIGGTFDIVSNRESGDTYIGAFGGVAIP